MADQHFSDFDDLVAAGWSGAEMVEAAGLLNGTNVRFPVVVNGIDGTISSPAFDAQMQAGNGLNDNAGANANVYAGHSPGSAQGGQVAINGGNSDSGPGGNVYIRPGVSNSGGPGFAALCDPTVSSGFGVDVTGVAIFGLGDYADDAAAASGGVPVGYLYWKAGLLTKRVS